MNIKSVLDLLEEPMSIYKDALAYKQGKPLCFDIINVAIIYDVEFAATRYALIKTLSQTPLENMDQAEFKYVLNEIKDVIPDNLIKENEKEIQAILDEMTEKQA